MSKLTNDITAGSAALAALELSKLRKNSEKSLKLAEEMRSDQAASNRAQRDLARQQGQRDAEREEADRRQSEFVAEQVEATKAGVLASVKIQSEVLESALRREQAERESRERLENEDGMVGRVWEVVEGAKIALRDKDFYLALICAVSARGAYKDLIKFALSSDSKMKLSQLNQDACDVLDGVLAKDNIKPVTEQGISLLSGIREFSASVSAANLDACILDLRRSIEMQTVEINTIDAFVPINEKLVGFDLDLDRLLSLTAKPLRLFEKFEFALAPLTEDTVQEFLKSHSESIAVIKTGIENSVGATINSTFIKVERIYDIVSDIVGLQNLVKSKQSSIRDLRAQIEAEAKRAALEASKNELAAKERVLKATLRPHRWIMLLIFISWCSLAYYNHIKAGGIFMFIMIGYSFFYHSKKKKTMVILGIQRTSSNSKSIDEELEEKELAELNEQAERDLEFVE